MSEPNITRCPDLMRQHQRTHGVTCRSMRDATGRFAKFDDCRAVNWMEIGILLLAGILVAWVYS